MALLQPGSVLMSKAPVSSEGHVDAQGLGHHLGHSCIRGLCCYWGHAYLSDLCCLLVQWRQPVLAAARDHVWVAVKVCVEVQDPCCHQRSHVSPESGQQPVALMVSKDCAFLSGSMLI